MNGISQIKLMQAAKAMSIAAKLNLKEPDYSDDKAACARAAKAERREQIKTNNEKVKHYKLKEFPIG